jgi:DNA-binding transcriptional LysR family regulator
MVQNLPPGKKIQRSCGGQIAGELESFPGRATRQLTLKETMPLHSNVIRYFDAVRKAGSIRAAARVLEVSSSAVSRQILKLEREIGAQVFERLPCGLKISSAGEILAHHVALVLKDGNHAYLEIRALSGLSVGRINIMATESLSDSILPTALKRMSDRFGHTKVSVTICSSSEIANAIINGDSDLGFAFSLLPTPDLKQLAVGRFQLGAVVAPNHPLLGKKSVRLEDCASFPLIMPDIPLELRSMLEPIIAHSKRPILPIVESDSVYLMKELAKRNEGVALLTRIGLETEIRDGSLVHIPLGGDGPIFTELGLYTHARSELSIASQRFVEFASEEIRRYSSEW